MEENLNTQATKPESNVILVDNAVELSIEVRDEITKKIAEIRQQTGVKRIQAIVVAGDEFDEKPLYIGYFRRPNTIHFSLWMNQAQKDPVQANKTLAQNCFLGGDKALVDDEDLFLYGTMSKIAMLVESRNADLVKLSSAAK